MKRSFFLFFLLLMLKQNIQLASITQPSPNPVITPSYGSQLGFDNYGMLQPSSVSASQTAGIIETGYNIFYIGLNDVKIYSLTESNFIFSGGINPFISNLTVSPYSRLQEFQNEIYFIATDNYIYRIKKNSNGTYNNIPEKLLPNTCLGTKVSTTNSNLLFHYDFAWHIYYVGTDNKIYDFVLNGSNT